MLAAAPLLAAAYRVPGERGMKIRTLGLQEPVPWDLLLEADPDMKHIKGYIAESTIRAAELSGRLVGICVSKKISSSTWEIMNISVDHDCRGKGIGAKLIRDAEASAKKSGGTTMVVGTGNSSIRQLGFYQRCGYRITGIIPDYFIHTYGEPIYEDGIPCRDMIRLEKQLVSQ